MYSCGPPHMDVQEWDDQLEPTYSSCVRTRDVTLKTCRRRWMIGRNGERRSGISAQAARHDDDDDIYIYIYIYQKKNLGLYLVWEGVHLFIKHSLVWHKVKTKDYQDYIKTVYTNSFLTTAKLCGNYFSKPCSVKAQGQSDMVLRTH